MEIACLCNVLKGSFKSIDVIQTYFSRSSLLQSSSLKCEWWTDNSSNEHFYNAILPPFFENFSLWKKFLTALKVNKFL